VLHIAKTSIYDNDATPSDALTRMKNTYAANTWHYSDQDGNEPDLHHLIMHKDLGGGEFHFSVTRLMFSFSEE
jgi:hypothetical protein